MRGLKTNGTAALIDRLSRRIEDAVAAVSVGESDEAGASRPQGADSAVTEAGLERLQAVPGR